MGKQIKLTGVTFPSTLPQLKIVRQLAGTVSTLATQAVVLGATVNAAGTQAYLCINASPWIARLNLATGSLTPLSVTGIASPQQCVLSADEATLYVSNDTGHVVHAVNTSTGVTTTLCGTSGTAGAADGTGTAATLNKPRGLARIGNTLYIGEGSGKLRACNLSTGAVTTINAINSATGQGLSSLAASPDGLYLYALDGVRFLRLVVADGTGGVFAGSLTVGDVDGVNGTWRLTAGRGLSMDDSGAILYFADAGVHKIKRLDTRTLAATTIAGSGTSGEADGVGSAATFNQPFGAAWIPGGGLVIPSGFGAKVRRIS